MMQMPVPPNRSPIVATKVLNAYKASALVGAGRTPAGTALGRPMPATPAAVSFPSGPAPPVTPAGTVPPVLAETLSPFTSRGPAAPDAATGPASPAAQHNAHQVLEKLQRMMGTLHERGRLGEYRQVYEEYKRLGGSIRQARAPDGPRR